MLADGLADALLGRVAPVATPAAVDDARDANPLVEDVDDPRRLEALRLEARHLDSAAPPAALGAHVVHDGVPLAPAVLDSGALKLDVVVDAACAPERRAPHVLRRVPVLGDPDEVVDAEVDRRDVDAVEEARLVEALDLLVEEGRLSSQALLKVARALERIARVPPIREQEALGQARVVNDECRVL